MATPLQRPALPPPAAAIPARPGAAAKAFVHPAGPAVPTWIYVLFMTALVVEYSGLPGLVPPLKMMRFTTLASYACFAFVMIKGGPGLAIAYPQGKRFLLFIAFTAASMLWAVVRSYVPLAVRYHFDYFALFVVTAFAVNTPGRIRGLAWVMTLVLIFLVAENIGRLGQTVRAGSFVAAYFMGDGNDFGWGLNVIMPLPLYMAISRRSSILGRLVGLAGFGVGVLGVVATQSRGATLALGGAMLLYWATVARRKALAAVMLVVVAVGGAIFAPSSYLDRMRSIDEYQDDSSAQGRLRAWKGARQMALDFPFGVGANCFNSAFGRYYMPPDPQGYAAHRWISAHSVYFKTLGEYGYPGLILFLSIIVVIARDNWRTAARIRGAPAAYGIDAEWPLMLNVSLIGYCVGGIFLGGITYPHLYLLGGLAVAARRMVEMTPTGSAPVTAPAPAAVSPVPEAGRRPALRPAPAGPGRFF
jgi:probable O-glycosylation ligase (exosortase A-associated)